MARNPNEQNGRVWFVLLYPDDPSQEFAIKALSGTAYSACGILHDKDINEDGTPKKPHYHFVVRFQNARGISVIANELHLDPRFLELCHSFKLSAEYLVHYNKPEKFQYPVTELFGSLAKAVEQLMRDDTEDERALKIVEIVEQTEGYLSFRDLIAKCAEAGLFSDLRRGGYLFVSLLNEHNKDVRCGYGMD